MLKDKLPGHHRGRVHDEDASYIMNGKYRRLFLRGCKRYTEEKKWMGKGN